MADHEVQSSPLLQEKAYRYIDQLYDSGVRVVVHVYNVVRYTPRGFWIDMYGSDSKFVLNGVGKRFAHLNQRDALHSYIARKSRQKSIYHHRMQAAEDALRIAQWMFDNDYVLEEFTTFGDMDIPLDLTP